MGEKISKEELKTLMLDMVKVMAVLRKVIKDQEKEIKRLSKGKSRSFIQVHTK